MQTGQNSIAPENSLPQLGQVCLVCVLILTTLQPQNRPSSNTTRTEWCEIGQYSTWHTVVSLHEKSRVLQY